MRTLGAHLGAGKEIRLLQLGQHLGVKITALLLEHGAAGVEDVEQGEWTN